MPHLHLPVQSGSDRILAAMNRRHTARRLSGRHRADARARGPTSRSRPTSSSAFPARPRTDFDATLALIDEVGYAGAYSFKYSPRPGTPAADMAEQVPEAVKAERLQRLQDVIDRHQAAFNARCLGRNLDVLFEKPGRHPGQIVGRSPYLQPVQVMARVVIQVAPVRSRSTTA